MVSDRIKAATGAAVLQLLLGYAVVIGLSVDVPARVEDALKVFDIAPPTPPPPPPKVVPRRATVRHPVGAAAPPGLRAHATPIVVPPPVVPPLVIPPIVAAPVAGTGSAASAGAAPLPGPGSGAGGAGTGSGSGGEGDGDGGGVPSQWLRGNIRDGDYPRAATQAGIQGSLTTRYVVGTNGRVTECTIVKSSGNALLDDTTCRLVMQRFRYSPARDANGRRIPDVVVENHKWVIEAAPPPPPPPQ